LPPKDIVENSEDMFLMVMVELENIESTQVVEVMPVVNIITELTIKNCNISLKDLLSSSS